MSEATRQSVGVIFCRCSISEKMPEDIRRETEQIVAPARSGTGDGAASVAGTDGPAPLLVVDDLCGLVRQVGEDGGRSDIVPALKDMGASCDTVIIVACAPRAVENLLIWSGLDHWLPDRRVLSLRDRETPRVLQAVLDEFSVRGFSHSELSAAGDWIPWFPVIDPQACVNCGKCFDFCLFGVYAREGEQVRVAHPENCKNNCPACARVCPVKAIIFPKFGQAPINGEPPAEAVPEASGRQVLAKRKAQRRKLFSDAFVKKIGPFNDHS